jgi:hypothetical protein
MPPETWDKLDELRGAASRGKFIAGLVAAEKNLKKIVDGINPTQ